LPCLPSPSPATLSFRPAMITSRLTSMLLCFCALVVSFSSRAVAIKFDLVAEKYPTPSELLRASECSWEGHELTWTPVAILRMYLELCQRP
jgi:hypothetical protein